MRAVLLALALACSGALAQGSSTSTDAASTQGTSTDATSTAGTSTAPTSHAAPTVERPVENIIFPGQTWTVMGRLPGGELQTFTVALGRAPSQQKDGVTTYANYDSDASGNLVLTRLWHDPIDEDPEFLEATRADADGHELHCFAWDPSKQADLTRFTGVLAPDEKALESYVQSGSKTGLGSCTIRLLR